MWYISSVYVKYKINFYFASIQIERGFDLDHGGECKLSEGVYGEKHFIENSLISPPPNSAHLALLLSVTVTAAATRAGRPLSPPWSLLFLLVLLRHHCLEREDVVCIPAHHITSRGVVGYHEHLPVTRHGLADTHLLGVFPDHLGKMPWERRQNIKYYTMVFIWGNSPNINETMEG